MRRKSMLAEKTKQIQKNLNRWAKREGVIRNGEILVISIHAETDGAEWDLSPENFFSRDRLSATGLSKGLVTRAYRCLLSSNWSSSHKTMREFLSTYDDVSKLLKIRNLGRLSADGIAKAIRQAGLPIRDSLGLVK